MSMYMIKVHDGLKGLKGLETILMEDHEDYEVGQKISISPKGPITVQDQHGNGVRITPACRSKYNTVILTRSLDAEASAGRPKMSILGTVIEKRY